MSNKVVFFIKMWYNDKKNISIDGIKIYTILNFIKRRIENERRKKEFKRKKKRFFEKT